MYYKNDNILITPLDYMIHPLHAVLKNYAFFSDLYNIEPFGKGLINTTFLVSCSNLQEKYILQKINTTVFRKPELIAANNHQIAAYLQEIHPDYLLPQPLQTIDGQTLVHHADLGCFRLTPFVPQSHTVDFVATPQQAYEAARQFGLFTSNLHGFNAQSLHTTIPDFHNLSLRYQQFEQAVAQANNSLLDTCWYEVKYLKALRHYTEEYENLITKNSIPVRVIHHDTKISNMLFDNAQKGICVIDLDTVMPGYFFSDVGDMCRTYLSAENEEFNQFSQISIRPEYFEAMATGYLEPMKKVMTNDEMEAFVFAGEFMIYMQALRFLTDYLHGNLYYPVRHPLHNLHRTRNQISLLMSYVSAEDELREIVKSIQVN